MSETQVLIKPIYPEQAVLRGLRETIISNTSLIEMLGLAYPNEGSVNPLITRTISTAKIRRKISYEATLAIWEISDDPIGYSTDTVLRIIAAMQSPCGEYRYEPATFCDIVAHKIDRDSNPGHHPPWPNFGLVSLDPLCLFGLGTPHAVIGCQDRLSLEPATHNWSRCSLLLRREQVRR